MEWAAKIEGRRLACVGECIWHIQRNERPFRHAFTDYAGHNGEPFERVEIVWAHVKPKSKPYESYTLMDMPEYETALRMLHEETKNAP